MNVYAPPPALPNRWVKAGITRIIWVCRQGSRNGQPFQANHCYCSNLNLDAPTFQDLIRSHWHLENGWHWVKAVTFKEDDPPRRGGFAPIRWAVCNAFLITLAPRLGCRTLPACLRALANQVHQVFRWLT